VEVPLANERAEERQSEEPFTRICELYVLWVIGEISAPDAAEMRAIEPTLVQTLGQTGRPWPEAVEGALSLPASIRQKLRSMWRSSGGQLSADRFAAAFVDANFRAVPKEPPN
jgi:hypothetical protein